MTELNIGNHVRRLRLEQHRTQQEIADLCSFTKSLLSKIESGKVIPPVATLVKIATALGTTVSALIEAGKSVETIYATNKEVEENIVKTERGYWIYPFATHHKKKKMQPFLFVARRGEVKEHHLTHAGEEFIYVIEGEMKVQVGRLQYHLQTGGSLYFNAAYEHQIIPVSKEVKYLDIFV